MKAISFLENAKVSSKELTFPIYENRPSIKVNEYKTENGKYIIPVNFDISTLKEYKGYKFVDKIGKKKNIIMQKIYMFAIDKIENRVKLYKSILNKNFDKVLNYDLNIYAYFISESDVLHVLDTLPKKYQDYKQL